jgi:hypothetical protein
MILSTNPGISASTSANAPWVYGLPLARPFCYQKRTLAMAWREFARFVARALDDRQGKNQALTVRAAQR